MDLNSIETKFNKGKLAKKDIGALINYTFGLSEKNYNLQNELNEYKESSYKKLSVDELIKLIRTHNQINIYTVYEQWCVRLFDLSICPNDIDVSCNWESSDISLKKVLIRAIEHIAEY